MQPQELRTLKILEAVEQEESPSQRELARQLNISLGLVNSFVKRLVNRGYFKVTTIPKNRVRYILTPKGAAEKTRLTYEYVQYSLHFFKEARKKLKRIFAEFEDQKVRRIAFYGAGELAEIAYLSLQETSLSLVAVFDDRKQEKTFFGNRIESPDNVTKYTFDKILLTVSPADDMTPSKISVKGVPFCKIVLIE